MTSSNLPTSARIALTADQQALLECLHRGGPVPYLVRSTPGTCELPVITEMNLARWRDVIEPLRDAGFILVGEASKYGYHHITLAPASLGNWDVEFVLETDLDYPPLEEHPEKEALVLRDTQTGLVYIP